MKMSVSYIIARAIEFYLNVVIKELAKKADTDNYYKEYAFISSKCNGVLYFTIFWSTPLEKILKKYTNNYSESYLIKLSK